MDHNKPAVFIYITDTDCKEGGNLLNKALKVYLINLSKNDKNFSHLEILNKRDAIKKFNVKENNGERLVVITNLNPVGSEIILNKIHSMAKQKIFGEEYKKTFHLVCLTDEKETLLHKLFNKNKNYNNENIVSSLLLLKYMDSVRALTFWNVFSGEFITQIEDFFKPKKNGARIFEQTCSLEGFDKLLEICDETNEKITGNNLTKTAEEIGSSFNEQGESTLSYLARLYKASKIGNLSLGGHEVRRDFYNQFSIPMNKNVDIDKRNDDIVTNTKRMMFMLFARDWARNIADNVWNRVKKYNKKINILIIDDQPQYFREEIKQLCKCFPKGNVKFYITEDYKKFINQLNRFGNDKEKMNFEVHFYDSGETKTCNQKLFKSDVLKKSSFVFIDLLLGTENLGFDIIKSLSRLKNEENEKPELKYDIFVLSRSTNTNDIQTALNKGAIGYIFKERIFSIPYRTCEVLLEPGKKEHDLLYYISPFSGLNRLPLKIIQKLKSSPFEDTKENRKWIKSIPKADLHCHIGGEMNAKITLELAVNIFRDTILAYLLTESFVYLENDSNNPKIAQPNLINFCRDKNVTKLLNLTGRAAKKLNEELGNNEPPSLKKHIQWISSNVSGIKKHQVICFILIQLAVIAKQKFKVHNSNSAHHERQFNNIQDVAYEALQYHDLKPKDLQDVFNKLIEAPCENKANKRKCGGQGLPSYLTGGLFNGSAVLQTKENLEKVADYIYKRSKKENVVYRELKITPSGFTQGNLTENNVINIFKEKFNERYENDKNDKKNPIPPLINIIIAGKRHGETKALLRNISLVLRDSMEHKFEDKIETRICGFDLVGEEMYYDPRLFRDSFRGLFEACTPLTIHAGEETDASKIWEAVYELNADRIGHGLSLVKTKENAKGLLSRFRDHKICIELCPKSNFLTKGFRLSGDYGTKKFQPYPLKYFLENKMQVTINTDDPAFSGSFFSDNSEDENFKNAELSQEYLLATELFKASFEKDEDSRHLTQWEILKLIKMGFKHAFLDINIKRELMRIADEKIYDIIIKKYKTD